MLFYNQPLQNAKYVHFNVCVATLSVYPHRASLKNMPGHGGIPPWPGIFFKLARCGYTLRVATHTSYSPEYITS